GAEVEVAAEEERAGLGWLDALGYAERAAAVEEEEQARVGRHGLPMTLRKHRRRDSLSWARAPGWVCASSSCSRSSWSGTPSFFTPSSSAVSPQRSSDSVNTILARVKLP